MEGIDHGQWPRQVLAAAGRRDLELDLTPARSGMDGPAAEPWVSVAAAGSMMLIEGSVGQTGDDLYS